MPNALDTLAAATALLGSLTMSAPAAAEPPADQRQARQVLRTAQVELYCDHDAAAMIAVREARRFLVGTVHEGRVLASIDEAAWHIRRHEMADAQRALVMARDRLA